MLSRGKLSHMQAPSEIQTMMAYLNWKRSTTSRSFMKRHPKGELSRSRYVALDGTLALTLSHVQVSDAPQLATSSRPPDDDETADVPEVLDVSGEDAEGVSPQHYPTRGLMPEWDVFGLHDQLMRALCHQSFTKPTPIQLKALPFALQGRDVVGVAETVRGCFLLLFTNTHTNTGIRENAGVWAACLAQDLIREKTFGIENPQTSSRVNTGPHSRTCAPNLISLERLLE